MTKLDKIQGSLLGLAIGDAVGVVAEFQERLVILKTLWVYKYRLYPF